MAEAKHNDRALTRAQKKRKKSNSRKDRVRSKAAESQLSVIERLLRAPVVAVKGGQPERMQALQAIMFQLVQRSLAGDKKAERTRQKFEEFAKRNSAAELEVVFVDNDYTTAFAASGEVDNV
ncbi:MAG: hypothetical protein ACREEK_19905 [Bradyrhizobium sp.]